jgi:hypothetical protein
VWQGWLTNKRELSFHLVFIVRVNRSFAVSYEEAQAKQVLNRLRKWIRVDEKLEKVDLLRLAFVGKNVTDLREDWRMPMWDLQVRNCKGYLLWEW